MQVGVVSKNYQSIFFGVKGFKELKNLYQYNIPCAYTGIPMIDSKDVLSLNRRDLDGKLPVVVNVLSKFENNLQPAEKAVFGLIKDGVKTNPNMNLQTFFQKELKPKHLELLKEQQYRIMDSLKEVSVKLPPADKKMFDYLMAETVDKIEGKAITVPFSRKSFNYDLEKTLKNMTQNTQLIKQITDLSKNLPAHDVPGANTAYKQAVMSVTQAVFEKIAEGRLRKIPEIRELLKQTMDSIDGVPVNQVFSNKQFHYDLDKALKDTKDRSLVNQFKDLAKQLPTSLNSFSAYIVKLSNKSSTQIAESLLDPSIASLEHVQPHSLNGQDSLYNFLLVAKGPNSERGNISLYEHISKNPTIIQNIQRQFDALSWLEYEGIFDKWHVKHDWLEKVAEVVKKESHGLFKPDSKKFLLEYFTKRMNREDTSPMVAGLGLKLDRNA